MEAKDLIATPVYLLIFLVAAYFLRPQVSTPLTRRYFFPALMLKFLGALFLGLIYQFYYGGGDTFGYTTYGASHIWRAFLDEPPVAFDMIFGTNEYTTKNFKYAVKIWYFDDAASYFVVRVAGILSLLSFNTYSVIALLFAIISFSGLWAFYTALTKWYPKLHLPFAIAIFGIPSVVFWGSGVMKDTLTIGALGWAMYALVNLIVFKKQFWVSIPILVLAILVIYTIKIYILLCFFPSVMIWLFFSWLITVKNKVARLFIAPLAIIIAISLSFWGLMRIAQDNEKYSLDALLDTAEITAMDNSSWTVRKDGSGYNLGDYDFSPNGLVRKFFPAVWVTLFRPYPWEANSPIMLLSALESTLMLLLTLLLILKVGLLKVIKYTLSQPIINFCLIFSVSFAFAVGLSSGNFGSLVRYKIPIIPFFLIALYLIQFQVRKQRNQQRQSRISKATARKAVLNT